MSVSSRQVRAELLGVGYRESELREIDVRRVLRVILQLARAG